MTAIKSVARCRLVLQRKERLFEKAMNGWAKARKEKRLVAAKMMKETADKLDKQIPRYRSMLNGLLKKQKGNNGLQNK